MMELQGRRVVLVVTGSVAAFKGAELASLLTKSGADVRVVLTAGGERFVSPETFSGLTGNQVALSLWNSSSTGQMDHIELANWCELLVVAPASANTIARIALGLADDLAATVALATRAPILVAPAMETRMYTHEATQAHLQTLRQRGALILEPVEGRLASGSVGLGRMIEPENIRDEILALFSSSERGELAGVNILVTAGPTQESIDPVRFISNRSSGKMGYAIAEAAASRGARVTLVSGPVAPEIMHSIPPQIVREDVATADEMCNTVLRLARDSQVVIMSAAVADYRPVHVSEQKYKKREALSTIPVEPTDDILERLGKTAPHAILIGFAAETEDVIQHAEEKLKRKGLAMIIANDVSGSGGRVFGEDHNEVTIIRAGREPESLPSMPKWLVAQRILDYLPSLISKETE